MSTVDVVKELVQLLEHSMNSKAKTVGSTTSVAFLLFQ